MKDLKCRDRYFIGIMCGSPFGIVGMIVTVIVAFIFNKVCSRIPG